MKTILVGIGEVGLSDDPEHVVKTMALGSCVAIVFLAPKIRTVGLAHVALPDSSIGKDRAKDLPGYFADTAISYLINELKKRGVQKSSDVIIKLAGGANIMDHEGVFNIGKRNVLTIRKLLWHYHLSARAEDVGGNFSRTVWVEVKTGKVFVSSPRKGVWEI